MIPTWGCIACRLVYSSAHQPNKCECGSHNFELILEPSMRDDRYKIFQHADGDYYAVVDPTSHTEVKTENGWEPAVHYRPVLKLDNGGFCFQGVKQYTTTATRWAERFTEIER